MFAFSFYARKVSVYSEMLRENAPQGESVGAVAWHSFKHHTRVGFANPGDIVGLYIKGLVKSNIPRSGFAMVFNNSLKESSNMVWWKGLDVECGCPSPAFLRSRASVLCWQGTSLYSERIFVH